MIVFPLICSVGLKAATASSRAATLPMICPQPTVPDPLDELTQLFAIGYDDEVDWTDGDEDPVSACRHWLALP